MFICGSGYKFVNVRPEGTHFCPVCERQRPYWLVLEYTYSHLYLYAKWVTSRQYHIVCKICGRGESLNRKSVESTLEHIPIPFMDRYGALVCFALIPVIIILIVMIDSH